MLTVPVHVRNRLHRLGGVTEVASVMSPQSPKSGGAPASGSCILLMPSGNHMGPFIMRFVISLLAFYMPKKGPLMGSGTQT